MITVTGCTPGIAANSTRPAATAAASVAISATSFAESGLRSSHEAPTASNAKATSRSESPSCELSRAAQTDAANATVPAAKSVALDKNRLLAHHDDTIRNRRREFLVVRHEQRCTRLGFSAEKRRELGFAFRIDAAGRLVEDEQVWLDDEDGSESEPLALAAREITRMTSFEPFETDGSECAPSPGEIALDPARNFIAGALG